MISKEDLWEALTSPLVKNCRNCDHFSKARADLNWPACMRRVLRNQECKWKWNGVK